MVAAALGHEEVVSAREQFGAPASRDRGRGHAVLESKQLPVGADAGGQAMRAGGAEEIVPEVVLAAPDQLHGDPRGAHDLECL
jgi:hypothetical protein